MKNKHKNLSEEQIDKLIHEQHKFGMEKGIPKKEWKENTFIWITGKTIDCLISLYLLKLIITFLIPLNQWLLLGLAFAIIISGLIYYIFNGKKYPILTTKKTEKGQKNFFKWGKQSKNDAIQFVDLLIYHNKITGKGNIWLKYNTKEIKEDQEIILNIEASSDFEEI